MDKRITPYDGLKTSLREILSAELNRLNKAFNDMDEVFPGIYLGGVDAAKNAEKLKQLGVTHIVNASYTTKPTMFSPLGINTNEEFYQRRGLECQFLGISAMDISGFKISQYFDTAADFIHSAIEGDGKVLVHCFQGVSRSATIVLAYLMMKQNMTATQALHHVKTKRSCVHPNEGFLEQICHLHKQTFQIENEMQGEDEHSTSMANI